MIGIEKIGRVQKNKEEGIFALSMKGHEKLLGFLHRTSIVWKIAFGSGISWELAKLAGTKHPFLAPITLILCVRDRTTQSLTFTLKRVAGTILGILIIVMGMTVIGDHVSVWELTGLMFLGLALTKVIRLDNVTIREAALSIVLILALEHKSPQYPIDRMRDTVIGALVSLLFILIILPVNHFRKAKKAFKDFADRLANDTTTIGQWLEAENTLSNDVEYVEQKIKSLFKEFQETFKVIHQSRKDLFFNLYAKRQLEELNVYKQNIRKLEDGMLYLCNICKTLMDWSESGMMTKEERTYWAAYMSQLAVYIREWTGNLTVDGISVRQQNMKLPAANSGNRFRMSVDNDLFKLIENFQSPNVRSDGSSSP